MYLNSAWASLIAAARAEVRARWDEIDAIALQNHEKVLQAFQDAAVGEHHFAGSTGYAYGDAGRDALEEVFRSIFCTEAALVRPQIASGTHAITACLFGNLRPGDELLSLTGPPYDTLQQVIGTAGSSRGSLKAWGVRYRELPLNAERRIDRAAIPECIGPNTRMVMVQRSRGYSLRPSCSVAEIAQAVQAVKGIRSDILFFVDNCYGEFVETAEPTQVGVDLLAGSLIKNAGGGLAPSGGYIVGRKSAVTAAAEHLTAPGVGAKVGPMFHLNRTLFQGSFLAPHVVSEALKGAVLAANLFAHLGFEVHPAWDAPRADLVQAILLGSPEAVQAFCAGVQGASPVDHRARPTAAPMPGYEDKVIMAGGTFVQGSSIELSADAPMRPPYAVFLQGGLFKEHVILALQHVLLEFERMGIVQPPEVLSMYSD